jgi:hypothetical protein
VGNIGLVKVNSTAKQKKTTRFFLGGSNKTDVLLDQPISVPDFREIFSGKKCIKSVIFSLL